jgi:hypothetical protein
MPTKTSDSRAAKSQVTPLKLLKSPVKQGWHARCTKVSVDTKANPSKGGGAKLPVYRRDAHDSGVAGKTRARPLVTECRSHVCTRTRNSQVADFAPSDR